MLSKFRLVGYCASGFLVLCLVIAWQAEKRHAHKLSDRVTELSRLREADRQSYIAAQKQAAADNAAQVAGIKQQQEQITDEVSSDLNSRLERIRRELRAQAAASPGSSGHAATGGASEAPCRAADPAWLCLSPEERVSAAESEERHDQLITWVERQSAIDPNREPPR